MKCRTWWVVLAILTLPLAGCASTAFRACPPLIQYSDAEQERAADELEQHGADVPTLAGMIDDYGRTRDAIRACRAK